jgi:hypothetical protein
MIKAYADFPLTIRPANGTSLASVDPYLREINGFID